MRFEEVYGGWRKRSLTQEEAARVLGVCQRTFRRLVDRYEESGLEGLIDKRLNGDCRRVPVDEVFRLIEQYKGKHEGWNARHFYAWYRRGGGTRSYTWVKCRLQDARLIAKAPGRGKHRKHRERAAWQGMMLHQDGSKHQWVPGVQWDLVLTMDDATNEHYSLFFVEEEGTKSSFQGVKEVIETRGLFSSIYTDRGSHYWTTPEAGGKVDRVNLTQFGRAMKNLGIHMIPAYSPEARGRCERMFRTHQERLPKELALAGITEMGAANHYIKDVYLPAFNEEFRQPSMEEGSVFVPYIGTDLDDIVCEQYERVVGKDNCICFEGLKLQIPADQHRLHYVKVTVRVNRYPDGSLAIFHGPRRLACYSPRGDLKEIKTKKRMRQNATA
jgi:transposase